MIGAIRRLSGRVSRGVLQLHKAVVIDLSMRPATCAGVPGPSGLAIPLPPPLGRLNTGRSVGRVHRPTARFERPLAETDRVLDGFHHAANVSVTGGFDATVGSRGTGLQHRLLAQRGRRFTYGELSLAVKRRAAGPPSVAGNGRLRVVEEGV